jgi:L-rhamnose mutarotase
METFRRYCKTLELEDDPDLIEAYKKIHATGAVWPEVTKGMKEVGIVDMEIYIFQNRLFMIMETVADFDHDKAFKELSEKDLQKEWEAYVSQFQKTLPEAGAAQKWQIMERIYKMDN